MTEGNENKFSADVAANDSTADDQRVKQLKSENENKTGVSDSTIQSVHKMCQELLEKQNTLETSISGIVEKLRLAEENFKNLKQDLQEKFDSTQVKQNEIDETLKPVVSPPPVYSTRDFQENKGKMSTSGKCFVLKHTFNNISSFKNNTYFFSEKENHFGVPWWVSSINVVHYILYRRIYMERNDGCLSFFLSCLLPENNENTWEIDFEFELKIVNPSANENRRKLCHVFKNDGSGLACGLSKFIAWEELEDDFVVDDCFCAEIAVNVKRMTGIYKENLRSFDETMKEFSDVVLIVNDEKFYVLKLVSKITIEGILMVADMFDTPLIIQKCENFLLKESKKRLKKKLEMSIRYNLDALKKQCISEIKSIDDIKSVIPGDIHDMDSSIMAELFQKFLKLH
ncbi:hypothetical protein CRE_21403 [Caenorhabditis remanei]|uniref:MATH domain-containing protein n=1 Tax=Caenorhabditis remanei TaxID=31234 RepID=E3MUR2_CAERE|nr:hypothetical protein CRE_21403 [Caenorhabditis remanei]